MKKSLLTLTIIVSLFGATAAGPNTHSFMSDKTEIAVDLEVSGAEALCQTSDGYIWIGQYSGLVRYDSNEYVTYKDFTEGDKEYSIVNVTALANKDEALFIATNQNIFIYDNYQFSCVEGEFGVIRDIVLDDTNDLLYISSLGQGASLYDINSGTVSKLPNLETGNVYDIALDVEKNNYYYQLDTAVYDKSGKQIYQNKNIYEIYSHDGILYIGHNDGLIVRYDMANGTFLSEINVGDQINKMYYSVSDEILFVACEKNGLCCIDLNNDASFTKVSNLENGSQLVDIIVDYQGNLWVASHASGVSLIAKNSLLDLLFDDAIWKDVTSGKSVIAIERYGDTLYFATNAHVYSYDLNTGKILPDGAIMQAINDYLTANSKTSFKVRDIEIWNHKIYVSIDVIGCLLEYDPATEATQMYDTDYIVAHADKLVGDVDTSLLYLMRYLRGFDTYLALSYEKGIIKFDGEKFSIMATNQETRPLFISKTDEGQLIFNRSKGIYVVDDDFSSFKEIPTIMEDEGQGIGNILKILVDGNRIYHTINSRLFRLEENNGKYTYHEIIVPYVKGSLTELSKISYINKNGETVYKYVIASQGQIYITDNLDGDVLTNYEFYDRTNGLPAVPANTSGYYDQKQQKYYFQTEQGIFVYDFNEVKGDAVPVKVCVSSIELDDVASYGNVINIKKETYRVKINLSVFGFKPNKGYNICYKLDGIDDEYHTISDTNDRNINYTNLPGGSYRFHAYAIDEYGQKSNIIDIQLIKERHVYEHVWFWVIVGILSLLVVVGIAFFIIRIKTRQALKKQLEYKNITVESIQAIARTIDAKDEYTNGHSTRVGYYSKLIAQHLGMSEEEVDNIYYIALLHDIGKIAIPDKILNKPGRLTDEEFAVMKSHTTRGAKILSGISTIPHIIEGAKSHHEKYDGTGYPEGLKGEQIPFVARIICCADCFDAMASKRVYKEPFSAETIINEFRRCEGTQFDPKIAEVVIDMMAKGILKPYSDENVYLGEDGKTHRIVKSGQENN